MSYRHIEDINRDLAFHERYRTKCINLIASENCASKTVLSYLSSDLSNRYGCYENNDLDDREYTGNRYIAEMEKNTHKLLLDVFGGEAGRYCDIRPISGHMAGMSVVTGVIKPGESMMEVSWEDWGHGLGSAMVCNNHWKTTIDLRYIPFNGNLEIDLEKLHRILTENPPKLLVLGASGMLWLDPIKEIREMIDPDKTILAYDVSHISGLIACGVYPNPLDLGCDIIFGSTHKSFPGPQGGFVICKDKGIMDSISEALSPCMVTSHHINRIPALACALLEIKEYGSSYGAQIVKCSQKLGEELAALGFDVIHKGDLYSQTHQVIVRTQNLGADAYELNVLMEKSGLLCSGFHTPLYDIRIGTQEMVRRGMKESDCAELAMLIKRAIIDREDSDLLTKDIEEFASRFDKLVYSFD